MATEMKTYVVGIVMECVEEPDKGKLQLQHHKVQGRSEYEAIGYALIRRSVYRGKIVHIANAIVCDGESRCGDNAAMLLDAD